MFRLRGKGIKGVRASEPGDLFCHVVVETPVNLTSRQRELLREFEAISQQDAARHNPRAKGWFDKVKEFFEIIEGAFATAAGLAGAARRPGMGWNADPNDPR